ncbi:MAG: heavy-metal-associated domain-containing protein [Mycobacterium sp.]|nr:heavy-metal-associated domain-containing protein [Mycobacterium sp.]
MGQTFSVTGLNCQSCVNHVTDAISGLVGVQSVSVDLEPKGTSTIHVEAAEPLTADAVQAALSEEGNYSLVR